MIRFFQICNFCRDFEKREAVSDSLVFMFRHNVTACTNIKLKLKPFSTNPCLLNFQPVQERLRKQMLMLQVMPVCFHGSLSVYFPFYAISYI